jgi:nucleotide-binding universal stress UspA family protein
MKLIIAATDFSPVSLNAVQYAATMAASTHSNLALFHVCEVPLPLSEVPVSSIDMQSLVDSATKEINKLRDKLLESHKGLHIFIEVRLAPSVLEQLNDYCVMTSPFVVIIGANDTGPVERFMLGNTAVILARELEWPLLVIPPNVTFSAIRNVGLASDCRSVVKSTPVTELKNIMATFNARLHVLHINEEGSNIRVTDTHEFTRLRELLKDLHPSYYIVNNGNIDEEISRFANSNRLDLLIVVPKKHKNFGKLFHKSHTKQIVIHSHIPTMAIHE